MLSLSDRRHECLLGVLVLGFVLCTSGPRVSVVWAQAETPHRVTHAAAGISMIPPAGWYQVRPRPEDANLLVPLAASERHAFLEQMADKPEALFLFAKAIDVDPLQTPKILVRVLRTGAMAGRPLGDLIAGMESAMKAAGDRRLVGRVERTDVSGLPAARAALRQQVTLDDGEFHLLVYGYFVPRGTYMLLIELTAPEQSGSTVEGVLAETLASIRIEQ
jgi:hypothetical protein